MKSRMRKARVLAWMHSCASETAISANKIKVYYKQGSFYAGAFEGVTNSATGGGASEDGSSSGSTDPFDGTNIGTIDSSLEYNFAKLLQLSLYFYDANMCGGSG